MAVSRRRVRLAASFVGALCVGLIVSSAGLPAVAGAPLSAQMASAVSPAEETDLSRPDEVSAIVTARASGVRVEDESQRTEFTRVYANPDGTWTNETASGPESVLDEDGVWRDIDTTLVERDGVLVPRAVGTDLELSDGGDRLFASMSRDGHDLGWRWDAPLPEPVVEGSTATYPGAVEGGDLVVTATATGFTHSVVLRERPAGAVEISIPVSTDGGDLVEGADGQLRITKPNGTGSVLTAPAPVMWDASLSVDSVPVETEPSGEAMLVDTAVGETAAGTPELRLTPDAGFLSDPDTVYPVTIDPTFTFYSSTGDTWVSNQTPSSQESSAELRVGTQDGGATRSRSYVRFNGLLGSIPSGADFKSASLVLRNFDSLSCTSSSIEVAQVDQDWTLSSISWSNQPSMTSLHQATFAPAMGYSSSCPAGDAVWDVTGIVNDWYTGAKANRGLRIKATSETSTASYRRYRSVDISDGSLRPRIDVTYNRLPGAATAPWPSPFTFYTAPGGAVTMYTNTSTPKFTASAPDADTGDIVQLQIRVFGSDAPGSTAVTGCQTPPVPAGTYTSCTVPDPIPDGTWAVRAKAADYYWYSGGGSVESEPGWGPFFTFTVDTQPPPAPTVSADNVTRDGYYATRPASNRFTITGASDTAMFQYIQDPTLNPVITGTIRDLPATNNSATLDWNPANGSHTLAVRTVDRAGNFKTGADGWTIFTWGVGGSEVATKSKVPTSTDTFPLSMSGPPGATSARLEWRYAGEETWHPLHKVKSKGSDWPGTVTPGAAGSEVNDLIWSATNETVPDAATTSDTIKAPALLETRACFAYPGPSESCSGKESVQLVSSAFGGNFPVTAAGPGRVALRTGEFATDATDVAVSGGAGSSLSVSRSYGSYTGPSDLPARKVFGPGWSGSLDGAEAGFAGMQLTDNTTVDGTLVLSSPTAETLTFAPNGDWNVRTGTSLAVGEWIGVDELTPSLGLKAAVSGTGSSTRFIVTDSAGVVTTFKATTAPSTPTSTTAGAAVFAAESVQEPGAGKTTYDRDTQGRVTRILGALPAGMTAGFCTTSWWAAGCRALEIEYATTTTATTGAPGDVAGQVKQIRLHVYDAANYAGTTKTMASYAYDTAKRLVSVTDGLTGLVTGYGYDSGDRLTTITPPGLTPFQVEYDGGDFRLSRVKRDRPAASGGGTATLATVLYGLVPDVPTPGLPDVRPQTTSTWLQSTAAVYGAAVFGPDKPVATLNPSEVDDEDWPYAALWYTDFGGRTVNTGSYGAGDWQLTSTSYDPKFSNPARQLSAGDIAAIKSGALNAQDAGTKTVYNNDTAGPANTPAGTVVTDVYGTARPVRAADGTPAMRRPHTHTTYDEGAPNQGINPATGQGWALPTTITTNAVEGSDLTVVGDPVSVVKKAYGDTAGWTLGLPTSSTTVMDGGQANIVTTASYDTAGRVIEQRQPKSNGTDAGTRRTIYYTNAANTAFPSCGTKPDWEGLVCRIYYAGAPSNGPALPVTTVNGYDQFLLQPATTTETSGAVTRTTNATYDAAGRAKTSWTTLVGMTSAPAPGTELEYDPGTGLPTKQWATDATGARTSEHIDTGYDVWGRATTYTPYGDPATTTSYDPYGRVASVADPKGTTTYTYDGGSSGNDAAGKAERRGLVTKLSVTGPGGDIEFSGAYDADGNLTLETLPGGLARRTTYDTAGQQTGLAYSGTVTHTDTSGTTTDPDAPWLAWSLDRDSAGRVIGETTPDAAAPTGGLAAGTATAYTRGYTYDRAGRLTKVIDNTAPPGAAQYDTGNNLTGVTCQTREYAFDANGNRTSLTRRGASSDGTCSTTVDSSKTWAYDTADRYDTGSGYTYDNLGRVTTLPAADTPIGTSAGNTTLGYYDTNAARAITQNGTTSTYTLDAAGRRAVETTGPTSGAATTTVTSHFTESSDNPGWVERAAGGATTTSRYVGSIGGDLGAALTGTTLALALANPHGDIVTTVTVPSTGAATGIDSWSTYDEYGNPLTANIGAAPLKATTGIDYGWVGSKQRATQSNGLVLMGARLYNSATGAFTSMDPVYGGNTTTYAYPQDPVNGYDLDGECWGCNTLKSAAKGVGGAVKKGVKYVNKNKGVIATTAATGLAVTSCAASVVCGVAVSGIGAAAIYGASQTDQGKTPSIKNGVKAGIGGIIGGGLKTGPPKPGTHRAPGPTRWLV